MDISETPLPKMVEIIRAFSSVLDTKGIDSSLAKKIDDQSKELSPNHLYIQDFFQKLIQTPLNERIMPELGNWLSNEFNIMLTEYKALVKSVSFEVVSRSQTIDILAKGFFPNHGANAIAGILRELSINPIEVFQSNPGSATASAITYLKENNECWRSYESSESKQQRDLIQLWLKGQYIPSFGSICQIAPEDNNASIARCLLLIASSIDRLRVQDRSAVDRVFDVIRGKDMTSSIESELNVFQQQAMFKTQAIHPAIGTLQQHLRRTNTKDARLKRNTRTVLDTLIDYMGKTQNGHLVVSLLSLFEGRWHVYNGQLAEAVVHYKRAFQWACYRGGELQEDIFRETMVIAANQPRPDKNLLKQVKNMMVTLGYEVGVPGIDNVSAKASDIIEDWEVAVWANQLPAAFPQKGLFPGASHPARKEMKVDKSANLFDREKGKNTLLEPDFKTPNKKINFQAANRVKRTHQLIHFCEHKESGIVSDLLNAGASVNVSSDSGDTPILLALGLLDLLTQDLRPYDDTIFRLISEHKHSSETINRVTDKRKLAPIHYAVQSGRPYVVLKMIELGANVNLPATIDNFTPLFNCLRMIEISANPERLKEYLSQQNYSPLSLEAAKRYSNGVMGVMSDQVMNSIKQFESDDEYKKNHNIIVDLVSVHFTEHTDIEKHRQIACLLIDHGADTNAVSRQSPGLLSPLMYAISLDERSLVDTMLTRGADLYQTWVDPVDNKRIDLWKFAERHQAWNVLKSFEYLPRSPISKSSEAK